MSLWNVDRSSSWVLITLYILLSSAYKAIELSLLITPGKSLMYTMKNDGPTKNLVGHQRFRPADHKRRSWAIVFIDETNQDLL